MYLEDIYSVAASLAGICGISVPCGETKAGLPIGVQIMGRHFDGVDDVAGRAGGGEAFLERQCSDFSSPRLETLGPDPIGAINSYVFMGIRILAR